MGTEFVKLCSGANGLIQNGEVLVELQHCSLLLPLCYVWVQNIFSNRFLSQIIMHNT
jgi:hypothetical protein